MFLKSLFSATTLLAGAAVAVNPANVSGIAFVDSSTHARIDIVGVDYQPGGESGFDATTGQDVLSDGKACLRDAVVLQQLGVNTIRVYNVNPATNHDDCMSIFNAAGIYVIIDVNSPSMALNRDAPWTSYYEGYLNYVFSNIENFMGYPNTLGFFAANEVINSDNTTQYNPQYIRAVVRDMRQYISLHSSRPIAVGYSAADVRDVLLDTFNYLTCTIGNGDNSAIQMFGLNSYSWCGASATFTSSGYDQIVAMFQGTSIPVFFSEFGCNQPPGQPRPFNEIQAIYGVNMTSLNGGLVYEYSQEENQFGLVTINSNGSVSLMQDFDNLQAQYNKLDTKILTGLPNANNNPPACETSLITTQGFDSNWTLPDQPPGAAALIQSGVQNPLNGKIVPVTSTTPAYDIYSSGGKLISGLVLKTMSTGNMPSGLDTSAGMTNGTGNGTTGGGQKKGDASVNGASSALMLIAGLAAGMIVLG